MGLFSAIGAFVSGVVGAIVSALTVISNKLELASLTVEGLRAIGTLLLKIAKVLGVVEQEDMEPAELGDRAIQAEEQGIVPQEFENWDEYVQAIKEFEVNPVRSTQIDEEAKNKRGAEILTGQLIAKYPNIQADILASFEVYIGKNAELFANEKSLDVLAEAVKEHGPESVTAEVVDYVQGKPMDDEAYARTENLMVEAVQVSLPDASVDEAVARIFEKRYEEF